MDAELLYELEVEFRKVGNPALIYDEERDLLRFTRGRAAVLSVPLV